MGIKEAKAIAAASATAIAIALAIGLSPLYASPSNGSAAPPPTTPLKASRPAAASSQATTPQPASPEPAGTQSPQAPTGSQAHYEARILGGGDVLLHMPVNYEAMTATGDYDYGWLFEPIRPLVSGADLALCGMETSLAPAGEAATGYPRFGAPAAIVPALKAEGWDGCSNANNHSADRGFAQIATTLDAFDAAGLGHAGTARTEEEAGLTQFYTLHAAPAALEADEGGRVLAGGDAGSAGRDLTIAHLSATMVDNDVAPIDGAPWAWTVVENERATSTIDDILERARQARAKGADLVVLSFHWGNEYETAPSQAQRDLARRFADSGAIDLVLGSHPHVPQPIEHLEGGPDGEGMWLIYSMGNLISNQQPSNNGIGVVTGALATATIEAGPEGPAHVRGLDWTAVTVDLATHRTYLLHELESGAAYSTLGGGQLAERRAYIDSVMGTPERTDFPAASTTLTAQGRR